MSIRSKLATLILALAVIPLLGLATFIHLRYRDDLRDAVDAHLSSNAAIQHSRLVAVMGQNRERLALVASRTQLRLSLRQYLGDPADTAAQARMNRILGDAARSIDGLVDITVYSPDGVTVASTDGAATGTRTADPDLLARALAGPVVDHLIRDADGELRVLLAGPLTLDEQTIGAVIITSRIDNLLASLFDTTGLGETGESVLFQPVAGRDLRFLAPTRHRPDAALRSWSEVSDVPLAPECLERTEQIVRCRDYRDTDVLACLHPIAGTDWILAVKIDRQEAFGAMIKAGRTLIVITVLVIAAVAVAGWEFSRRLSAPLVELAAASGEIADGRFGHQVAVPSQDEVGQLAESFNQMSDHIEATQNELQERIVELEQATTTIKTLQGIVPICAECKKIRDDQGYWNQLETYMAEHSEFLFSHGLCPDCLKKYDVETDVDRNVQGD